MGANPDEQPYVEMTRALIKGFPFQGGAFRIEPDASSGSYFLGAGWILRNAEIAAAFQEAGCRHGEGTNGEALGTEPDWFDGHLGPPLADQRMAGRCRLSQVSLRPEPQLQSGGATPCCLGTGSR